MLSERTGVNVPTIHFYESIGLLPAPERTDTNRRTYNDDTVQRLRFIRHARELGFEVEAIRTLPDLAAHPEQPCAEVDVIARRHRADIDDRVTRLTGLRTEVQAMLDQCTGGQVRGGRVIAVLADHGKCRHDRH